MKYVLLSLILFFSSCMPIVKVIYGIKKPSYLSQEKIQKSADKYELDHFDHYSFSSVTSYISYIQKAKELGLKNSINVILAFNDEGQYYQINDTIDCSSDYLGYVNGFPDEGSFTDKITFSQLFGDSLISNTAVDNPAELNSKFFVVTWASFVGKLNENSSKQWADSVMHKIKESDMKAIFINLDFHDEWEQVKFKSKTN